jgi:protease II
MGAGHGGKSGRWDKLHEVAETYTFILTQVE